MNQDPCFGSSIVYLQANIYKAYKKTQDGRRNTMCIDKWVVLKYYTKNEENL